MSWRSAIRRRGFTLIELIIAISIMSMISVLMYSAISGMRRSRDGIGKLNDRYHEGRQAMSRMTRELQSAFLSMNRPIDESLIVRETAFLGDRGTPADRVDFTAFAYRRLTRDAHESDQCEISYFGAQDPKNPQITDLVRRVNRRIDLEPDRGGRVQVLATNIDLFQLEYLDAATNKWSETWDTTQAVGQSNRLPLMVRITLVLNGGKRKSSGRGKSPITLSTKVRLPMQAPLSFTGR